MRWFLEITVKNWPRVGAWTGKLKNPTKCLWRGSPAVDPIFPSVRLHIYVPSYTDNVVIFAGGKFRENVDKTFHLGVIFTILFLFPS